MRFGRFSALAAALLAACAASWAQSPKYNLGRTPTDKEIRAWDISVGPEGKELPPGSGNAVVGAKIYAEKCALCHGPTATEGKFLHGVLVGGKESLTTLEPMKTIGSYWPYATTIFDYTRRAMPWRQPKTLTDDEVYALTAYILANNNIIGATDVMNAETLPKVQMPNRDGFIDADREKQRGSR